MFANARSVIILTNVRRFSATRALGEYDSKPTPRAARRTAFRLSKIYQTDDYPFWQLITALESRNQAELDRALQLNNIAPTTYDLWRPVLDSPSVGDAFAQLKRLGVLTALPNAESEISSTQQDQPIPPWLLFHLVANRGSSRLEVHSVLHLVLAQLPFVPINLGPSLLVFTTCNMARFSIAAPLHRVVEEFLSIPIIHQELNFNLLLQVISLFPSSEAIAKVAVQVVQAMKARQLKLHSRTYLYLLQDRFVTIHLAKTLLKRMQEERSHLSQEHLEAFLRVFATNGLIYDARKYMQLIREQAFLEKAENVPVGYRLRHRENTLNGSVHPSHTQYLSSFKHDARFAFQYLTRLLAVERRIASNESQCLHGSLSQSLHRASAQHVLRPRKTVDSHDWTTALSVAASNKRTSGLVLLKLFKLGMQKIPSFRPTVATYTVVLRGLLWRKQFSAAADLFYKLVDQLPLDRKSLTVGLQILTRCGRPHEAFVILETYAARVLQTKSKPDTPSETNSLSKVGITIVAMNEFLISLTRIRRPDVVFALWDHMEVLYGLRPDVVTFNILLSSVRTASKSSVTFRGTLALGSMFRKKAKPVIPRDRQSAAAYITSLLLDEQNMPRTAMTGNGIWRSVPAWQNTVEIFKQVILGNWPELLQIKPPAHAVRDFDGSSPMLELMRSLAGQPGARPAPAVPDVWIDAAYPEIVPNEETFFRYIQLIGTHGLSSDIPLALAWMRALDVKPSLRTLAMSLVFWGEVSLQAPLLDRWVGEDNNEFHKLERWMADWVGWKNMPKAADLGDWIRIVGKMRRPGRIRQDS